MPRRKLPKSKLKKFRSIGCWESDYQRILKEDKSTNVGIALIIHLALNDYLSRKIVPCKK